MSTSDKSEMLVVGTRGSKLAVAQTQWVIDRLIEVHPRLRIRQQIITTTGDRLRGRPLPEIGGKGLFTEELEEALLNGSIDLAVHSAKDLPTKLHDGLAVLVWPAREDPRDAYISADGHPFEELPEGGKVGTTSLRRQAQLLHRRGDLHFVALRGNVDTRIRKVHRGECDGAILAVAGLKRVALESEITQVLDLSLMLPAPGQGALALEGRGDDHRLAEILRPIHDEPTATAVICERRILADLDAGCRAPVAVYARIEGGQLHCDALVIDPQAQKEARTSSHRPVSDMVGLVNNVVADLRAAGAEEIIRACRPGD